MADEAPEYICLGCGWQTDEDDLIVCRKCGTNHCRKCGEIMITIEAYREAEANNARDAEFEDRRLGL